MSDWKKDLRNGDQRWWSKWSKKSITDIVDNKDPYVKKIVHLKKIYSVFQNS